ncbi:putative retrotransposon hot spot (RHS) protein [Trypanosoma cruzi]|nr:putative retrotransposon hot spot (RHS) protein [Trypanosoma cruzi]
MVLASEKGWPYSWHTIQDLPKDVFVNCEVERAWQIVEGDLTAWFSPHGGTDFKPEQRALIGTPGMGKSVAAGSYLLYQPLHCDVKKLQMVVYFIADRTFLFDKTSRAVTRYSDEDMCVSELRSLRGHGRNVYIIYDVAKEGTPPPRHFAPSTGWGMIAVSSPNVGNYGEWAKQLKAARIIVNCPDEMDVRAMCAWITRDGTAEKKAEYWRMVKERMDNVGPIPRHIFDANEFIAHSAAIEDALDGIKSRDGERHFTHGGVRLWDTENPPQRVVRVVRGRGEVGAEGFLNAPISVCLGRRIPQYLGKRDECEGYFFSLAIAGEEEYSFV